MPRLGGIQTVKQLRRAYPTKYYPVIMLTDDSDRARVKEAAELQINAYMIKSEFSMANLLDRIEKVLEQRADQRLTR
ncbi:MAG: hypothetical protein CMJ49_14175 [Planctomycetaceae bacterium]|nr:hypothetical protein [Planctomycetaceae bacterium]